jgi:hypothetical protein
MNLLRVQDKLKAREYRTIEEVLDHLQLIWDNCKAYNPEGAFYILADKMERAFKKMIRNYLPNIQVIVPSKPQFTQSPQLPAHTHRHNQPQLSPPRAHSRDKHLDPQPLRQILWQSITPAPSNSLLP